MNLRALAAVKVAATLTNPLDLTAPTVPLDRTLRLRWSDDSQVRAADALFTDRRLMDPGQADVLDVRGTGPAALPDGLGGTLDLATLTLLVVYGDPDNVGNVLVQTDAVVGGPGAKAGDGVPVTPGGVQAWASPSGAPVSASDHTVTVRNASATDPAAYEVIIMGASA